MILFQTFSSLSVTVGQMNQSATNRFLLPDLLHAIFLGKFYSMVVNPIVLMGKFLYSLIKTHIAVNIFCGLLPLTCFLNLGY